MVAGIDEVGRGCLAGPVVAAAVVLPARVPRGIRDSKQLSARARRALCEALYAAGAIVSVASASPAEIDSINIRQASFLAMRRALFGLSTPPDALLVDGFEIPDCPIPQRGLVKGDARSTSIAAASIIAKVYRDDLMVEFSAEHPEYGFASHKGYPTPEHLEALEAWGPCQNHRLSFAPVAASAGGSRI